MRVSFSRRLLNTLLPSNCLLCNALGDVLCAECFEALPMRWHEVTRGPTERPLVGLAATDYANPIDQLLRSFKDGGRASLDAMLAAAMAEQLGPRLGQLPELPALVPIASSAKSYAKRGFTPAQLLAEAMARNLRQSGFAEPRVLPALRRVRAGADQSMLGIEDRGANLDHAFKAAPVLANRAVWLVDDIATTGASLLEARRAVDEVGGRVLGFSVFAETLLKRDARNLKWV